MKPQIGDKVGWTAPSGTTPATRTGTLLHRAPWGDTWWAHCDQPSTADIYDCALIAPTHRSWYALPEGSREVRAARALIRLRTVKLVP